MALLQTQVPKSERLLAAERVDDIPSSLLSGHFTRPQRIGKPSGWWAHVPFAAWIVEASAPAVLVELGTHHGVSYAALCEAVLSAGLPTRCYAVDHWCGDPHAGIVGDEVYEDVCAFNEQRYAAFSELVRSEFDSAAAQFEDASIDLLHIDGYHTFEAVQHDYQTWRRKLSPRSVVLLHDTNVRRDGFGVHRLFAELALRYPHFEFLHGHGLGVIGHGPQIPIEVRQLCAAAHGSSTLRIRNHFAQLGAPWASLARETEKHASLQMHLATLTAQRQEALASLDAVQGKTQVLSSQLEVARGERDAALKTQQQALGDAEHIEMLRVQVDKLGRSREAARAETATFIEHLEQASVHQERQARELDDAMRRLEESQADRAALLSAQGQLQQHARLYAASVSRMVAALLQRHEDIVGIRAGAERRRDLAASAAPRPSQRPRQRRLPPGLGWLKPIVRRWRAAHDPIANVVRRSMLFDAQWYCATYPDVGAMGVDPAFHFAVFGSAEGRSPSPWFSTIEYLRQNPDIPQTGVNALYHYEVQGRRQGRPCAHALAPQSTIDEPASPATDFDTKEAFRRRSEAALDRFLRGSARIVLPVAAQPEVSIVLVLYNQAALSFRCLEALTEAIDVPAEVIVVDNASTDSTRALLERIDGCRILTQPENLHFLRGANIGAACARGRHVLFLNNDAMLKPGSLAVACQLLDAQPDVGAVGGKIVLLDGTLQEAGSIIWRDGSCLGYGRGQDPKDAAYNFRRDVDYCSGALLVVRRDLFEQLGGFDAQFAPAYYEDTDLCMRIRAAGRRVVYEPRVEISHFEFGSAPSRAAATKAMEGQRKRFEQRHAAVLLASHQPREAGELPARMRPHFGGRVLVIDDRLPFPTLGAGNPRACRLLYCLHEAGAFVSQYPLSFPEFDAAQARRTFPPEVEFVAGEGQMKLAAFLRARIGYYDVVIVSRPHNMDKFSRCCRDVPGFLESAAVVYDAEAIFALREQSRRQILGLEAAPASYGAMTLETEMRLACAADIVLAVSESEAQSFRDAGCRDVRVLGHCLAAAPAGPNYEGRRDFLFVGRLEEDDSPNVDSVRWFVGEVMPRLDRLIGTDYALNLVGGFSTSVRNELESQRVRFHGRVQDLRDTYDDARVFIAPTRFAAGIPHKVHEAASHGLPAVVSDLVAGQLRWGNDDQLLHAHAPEAFAAACARLYQDRQLWERLRSSALAAIETDCDPARFQSTVRNLLLDTRGDASLTFPNSLSDPTTEGSRNQTLEAG